MKRKKTQPLHPVRAFYGNKIVQRVILALAIIYTFYFLCFSYLDMHHVSINRNLLTGELMVDTVPGFEFSAPWVQVSRIDSRPMAINVPSSARTLNRKLVQFVPAHWKEFIALEGYEYWWWRNRWSFNSGHDDSNRGIKDIFTGYAYGTRRHPFIKEVQ